MNLVLAAVSANAFSVVTFITHCERRCDKFGVPPVDVEGALMEERLVAARHGAKAKVDDGGDEPRRFTLCSTSWLRDYFDDRLVVPYESALVMVRLSPRGGCIFRYVLHVCACGVCW